MDRKDTQYAGLGARFVALVIDFVLLSALFFPVTKLVKGTWLMTGADHRWNYGLFITDPLCLVFLAAIVVYFVVMEAWLGGTMGKLLVRLRVVDRAGHVPGLVRSLVRNLLRLVGCPAGDERCRCLADCDFGRKNPFRRSRGRDAGCDTAQPASS